MAEYNSKKNDNTKENGTENVHNETVSTNNHVETNYNAASVYTSEKNSNYNEAELTNPDLIRVTVSDTRTPIMVLFGPPQCGKTMVMLRLAEYLLTDSDYTIVPVRDYRPYYDTAYEVACDQFKDRLYESWAAKKNEGMDFMLLMVYYKGSPVVQILEAPGEGYYDPDKPKEHANDFRSYVQNTIINSPNPKVWVFFTEPNWMGPQQKAGYVAKINSPYIRAQTEGKRNSIILFNKVDTHPALFNGSSVNVMTAFNFVAGQYPNLFDGFKNTHPITSLWRKYNCEFVPFQTGTFTPAIDPTDNISKLIYNKGQDLYPQNLWNAVLKMI